MLHHQLDHSELELGTTGGQDGVGVPFNTAESDILLTSIFSPPFPDGGRQLGQGQSQSQTQSLSKRPRRAGRVANPPPSAPTPAPTSSQSHVCQLCRRVYERADHLQRHLRSHENARNYSCSRCPKRFNRPDLLTRHEGTHDRDAVGRVIRRTDRAFEACANCAAAKAKCEDQKPCSRCKAKDLVCEINSKKVQKYRTLSENDSGISSTDETAVGCADLSGDNAFEKPNAFDAPDGDLAKISDTFHLEPVSMDLDGDMLFGNIFQDMDFGSWDFNFGDISLPPFDSGPSSQSTNTGAHPSVKPQGIRGMGRCHEAFKRSPWLWEPEYPIDYVQRDTEGLQLHEDADISHSASALSRSVAGLTRHLKMTAATRDRLFAMILAEAKNHGRVPSFPSLELLNYLLQAHFVHDEYHPCYSWIHISSFDPQDALPELLACVIANGASFISVPAIWKFGLALQEVVRRRLFFLFESSNSNTRKLDCIQTYMLSLDIGIWSGFKRRIELSEGFLLPLVTMLRRAGAFMADRESDQFVPSDADPLDVLEEKWKEFVKRESFKRLSLHLFLHDAQTSIAFQKPPLLPFSELRFGLPAALDLWRAPSAEAWRAIYLSKCREMSTVETQTTPRVNELWHHRVMLDDMDSLTDIDLCYTVLLHNFHGLITSYHESSKFHRQGHLMKDQNRTRPPWLDSQQQEIYHDLCGFANSIPMFSNPELPLVAEMLKITLYVSLEELQLFAGKAGEEEAKNVSTQLENRWMQSSDSRYAVWHAGQAFRCARRMPPASLRGFNALTVYFAGLTLWVYGLLDHGDGGGQPIVFLDGEETADIDTFLQLGQGVPTLGVWPRDGGVMGDDVRLSDAGAILEMARALLKENYPVRTEPLPPLVESLVTLLAELGSGARGFAEDGG